MCYNGYLINLRRLVVKKNYFHFGCGGVLFFHFSIIQIKVVTVRKKTLFLDYFTHSLVKIN